MGKHESSDRYHGQLDQLDQFENDQEASKRQPRQPIFFSLSKFISFFSSHPKKKKRFGFKHTSTLLDICPLNLIRDILKPFQDRAHTLVSTDLHHDPRYGGVYHPKKRENDQVGNDHEEKVSSGHRTVQTGTCGRSLVLGDLADDDREKVAKEGRDNGWEDTRDHGELFIE